MIRMRNIIRYWRPERIEEWLAVAMAVILLAILLTMRANTPFPGQEVVPEKGPSSILILRESVVSDLRYGNVILIDYMIDGWQTNAYFRPGEESKYEQFWAELEKLGEVIR